MSTTDSTNTITKTQLNIDIPPDAIRCWHFVDAKHQTRHGRKIYAGDVHSLPPGLEVQLCFSGWHGSRTAFDTFRYTGWLAYRREFVLDMRCIWGDIQEDDSKLVGRYCYVESVTDVTLTILQFLVYVAESRELSHEMDWRHYERGAAIDELRDYLTNPSARKTYHLGEAAYFIQDSVANVKGELRERYNVVLEAMLNEAIVEGAK